MASPKKRAKNGYRAAPWPPLEIPVGVRRGEGAATTTAWVTATQEIVAIERLAHTLRIGGSIADEDYAARVTCYGAPWAPEVASALARILQHERQDLRISRLQQLAARRAETHWLPIRMAAAAYLSAEAWQALWVDEQWRLPGYGGTSGGSAPLASQGPKGNPQDILWQETVRAHWDRAVWADLIQGRLEVATVNAIYPDDAHPERPRLGPAWVSRFFTSLEEADSDIRRGTGASTQCAMRMLRARAVGTPDTLNAMVGLRERWMRRLSTHARWWPWVREFFDEITDEGARDPAWPWQDVELDLEGWIANAELPSPSLAHIEALLDRCQIRASALPIENNRVHAIILNAVLQRADLGWGVGRRVWARVTMSTGRWTLLQHGGLLRPGAWWQDATFTTELLATMRAMAGAGGAQRGLVALQQDHSLSVLLGLLGHANADAWLDTVLDLAAGAKGADQRRADQLLHAMRAAAPQWGPSREALLRALSEKNPEIRIWAQQMVAHAAPQPEQAVKTAGRARH